MEPPPHPLPPRKRFWRRHWFALLILAGLLFCTLLTAYSARSLGRGCFVIGIAGGNLDIVYSDTVDFSLDIPMKNFSISVPDFGGRPHWTRHPDFTGISFPIWMAMGVVLGWVSYREWRSRRKLNVDK
jgi:hypothetical protein